MTTDELAAAHWALAQEFQQKADYHRAIADELGRPRVRVGKRAAKTARREQRPRPTGGKRHATRDQVAAYLKAHPNAKPAEIAGAIGISASLASFHGRSLRKSRTSG